MVTRMGLIGIRMGLILKDKPICPQTEYASENKARMQYVYMAYCAMRVNSIGFMIKLIFLLVYTHVTLLVFIHIALLVYTVQR